MQRLAAITAFAVLVCVVGGTWAYSAGLFGSLMGESKDPYGQCRSSRIAGGTEQIGGPFTLVDKTGQTVSDTDVITKPSLLYFGYTFCPDVCPFDTARNAEAVDLLTEKGHDVTPIFITIDPERDTPDVVGEFAELLHDKMVGLTGSQEQIKAVSKAYRTYYRKEANADPEYYLVDHSTFTYLVLPEAGFVEFFRREVTPQDMADKVSCFIDAS